MHDMTFCASPRVEILKMAWTDKCTLAKQNGRRCTKAFSEPLFEYSQGDLKICTTHLTKLRSQRKNSLCRILLFGSQSELGDRLAAILDAYLKSHASEDVPGMDESLEDDQHETEFETTNNKKRKAEFPTGQTPLNECRLELQQTRAKVMRLQADIQTLRRTTMSTFGTAFATMQAALSAEKAKAQGLADDVERLTRAAQGNASDTERTKVLQDEVSRLQALIDDLQDLSTPSYREATLEEQSEFTRQLMEDADDNTDYCKMIESFMDSLIVSS